jgi:hypothetical protein
VQLERRVFRDHLRVAQQLFDRREEQGRPGGKLGRDLARLRERLAAGHYVIGESPVLRLGRVHPAAGHQEFHGHVVGNAPPQLDGAGVGQHADVDLGEGELRMLLHHDDVAAEHELEATAAGDAVDGGDERLVEVARVIETAEAAAAPVLI